MSAHEVILQLTLGGVYLLLNHGIYMVDWSPYSENSACNLDLVLKLISVAWDIILMAFTVDYVYGASLNASLDGLVFARHRLAIVILGVATFCNWMIMLTKRKRHDMVLPDTQDSLVPLSYENEPISLIARTGSFLSYRMNSSPGAVFAWFFFVFFTILVPFVEFGQYSATGLDTNYTNWNIISVTACLAMSAYVLFMYMTTYVWSNYAFVRLFYAPFAGFGHHDLGEKGIGGVPLSMYDEKIKPEAPPTTEDLRVFRAELKQLAKQNGATVGPIRWAKVGEVYSSVFFFLIPWPVIIGLNFCYASMFMEYFNDYGRIFGYLILCVYYPFVMAGFHNTFGVWMDYYIFSIKVLFQLFYLFPAMFLILSGSHDGTLTPSTFVHLQFWNNWGNTALEYRTTTTDYGLTLTLRYTVSIVAMLYVGVAALSMAFYGKGSSEMLIGDWVALVATAPEASVEAIKEMWTAAFGRTVLETVEYKNLQADMVVAKPNDDIQRTYRRKAQQAVVPGG
jgi:hypothetical protein